LHSTIFEAGTGRASLLHTKEWVSEKKGVQKKVHKRGKTWSREKKNQRKRLESKRRRSTENKGAARGERDSRERKTDQEGKGEISRTWSKEKTSWKEK